MDKVLQVIDSITIDKKVKSIINSLNDNQERSKNWLIEKSGQFLSMLIDPKIVVLAGWYGNLADKLTQFSNHKITSIDIDEECKTIGKKLYDNVRFKTEDISNTDVNNYNVVVCTSCEHIKDFNKIYDKITNGSLVIFQSNNYKDIKEHVNCKDSLDEFKNSFVLNKTLYSGELKLDKFTRYMIVGIK
jgi:trans-aconitate methyltransferase